MDDQRTDRAGGGMRFRKLTIAFSAVCGTVCLLLIALWVRRYFAQDVITGPLSDTTSLGISSRPEGIGVFYQEFSTPQWRLLSLRPDIPNINPYAAFSGFGLCRAEGELFGIIVPYWFLVVATGAPATVLLVKAWPWRFSLRTALIVTMLIAAVLALVVWAAK
jgi:hypothetical protein